MANKYIVDKFDLNHSAQAKLRDENAASNVEIQEEAEGTAKKIIIVLKNYKNEKISSAEFYISDGGGASPIDLNPPFLYRFTETSNEEVSSNINDYTLVNQIAFNHTFTIRLINSYFHIAMPQEYVITKVVTSNTEILDLNTNFSHQDMDFVINEETVHTTVYSFRSIIRPENIGITFTINNKT